jgi:NAD(P)-dependent dehydrogenase (short-subunit alcohol dehydrogenase family)
MGRIFITGSSAGLGQLAARWLVERKHRVVLHARDRRRAREALDGVPGAEGVLVGDLTRIDEVNELAAAANAAGQFDAVIHNAGVYRASGPDFLAVNTVAPYVLTCLMHRPQRLIYLSSSSHLQGRPVLEALGSGQGNVSYGDSKLHVLLLAKAVARIWPDVHANAVDPGWVPTRMGGPDAPDDLEKGFETQAWLAVSGDERAKVSGRISITGKKPAIAPRRMTPRCRTLSSRPASGLPGSVFRSARDRAPGCFGALNEQKPRNGKPLQGFDLRQ